MNPETKRKLTGGIALLAILLATAFWLRDNSLWPFPPAPIANLNQHNHPVFTYAQAGLQMDMTFRTKPEADGTLGSLAFQVTDLGTGLPKTDLEIAHGKPMHVVGVRQGDLNQFIHIHPELKGDEWVAEYLFTEPGTYSFWPGIAMGFSHVVERMPDVVVGQPAALPVAPEYSRTRAMGSNLNLTLNAPQEVKVEETQTWSFEATDRAGRQVILGKYLEENLHVNMVSTDLASYQHLHTAYGMINPRKSDSLDLVLRFSQPGINKVFVEFVTFDNPGQVHLAEFWVNVTE